MLDSPQPGWYQDPQDVSQLRYWDGAHWTDHIHAPAEAAPEQASEHTPTQAPETAHNPTAADAPADTQDDPFAGWPDNDAAVGAASPNSSMDQDVVHSTSGVQSVAVGLGPIPDDWADQGARDSTTGSNVPEGENSKLAFLIGTAIVLALLLGGVFGYHMFFSSAPSYCDDVATLAKGPNLVKGVQMTPSNMQSMLASAQAAMNSYAAIATDASIHAPTPEATTAWGSISSAATGVAKLFATMQQSSPSQAIEATALSTLTNYAYTFEATAAPLGNSAVNSCGNPRLEKWARAVKQAT